MERLGITGVVSDVLQRHAIWVPLGGKPQLITHENGGFEKGNEVTFDELNREARRKT